MNKLKNNRDKIWRNLFWSVLSQIITIGLGLIIPRITIVGYGSSVNGLLSSVSQIVAYLVLFEAGIKAVAQQTMYKTLANFDFDGTNRVLSAVNKNYKRIGLLYFICLFCISAIYPIVVEVEGLGYFSVAVVVLFSGLGNVVSFFITGKYNILVESDGKAYVITNVNTAISIINHILKIVLIYKGYSVVTVIVATFIIHMIQNIYIFRYVKLNYRWVDLSATPDMKCLEQSSNAFVHQISTLILRNTDILVLTLFCNLKIVSIYTIYKLILGYLSTFMLVPLNSCNFAMGQMFNKDRNEYIKYADALEVCFNTLVFAVSTTTSVLILPFVSIYTAGITDVNYVDKYVAMLFIFAELLDLIRMPCLRTINYAKHYKETMYRSILESAINLVTSIVGVIYIGIYGVLLGTVVALLYRTVDILLYSNKRILGRTAAKSFISAGINVLLMMAITVGCNMMRINITNFFDFIIAGIIITPVVLFIYFAVNIVFFKQDIMRMLALLKLRKK